ncbi:MAG TPA: sulfatase-like hydrolase/transferase, partial [Acidimicrobiales bacterium]
MTDETDETDAADDEADAADERPEPDAEPPGGEPQGTLRRLSGWRYEALLALELLALTAFAVARPVLDSFGRSPETFVARGAGTTTIVTWALLVTLVPAAVLALVGLLARAGGGTVRWWAHLALVAVAGGVAVWRLVRDQTGRPGGQTVVIAAGVAGGLVLAALRRRLPPARTFLRIAGAASAVYLGQFLVLSPTSELVLGDRPGVDAEVAADVSAALGDDPPNVAVLVFDALPTETLLDGTGHIDADLFPNFAALAGTASWYRDSTTVSMYTRDAVPAILTGRYPDPQNAPEDGPSHDPENLFTLLGGTYDMHVREQITQLCPGDLCARPRSEGLGRLLDDAATLWQGGDAEEEGEDEFALPSVLDDHRYDEAIEWVDDQDFGARGPQLWFYHAVIPHDPWEFTADGDVYETGRFPTGYREIGWTDVGIEVGRRRHVLQSQAADRILGRLLDGLREAGTLDDTLVVVTADHGHAFVPNTPWRWLAHDNYEQLAWAPLLIKAPGQTRGEVVDDNVMSIDIVPTVADLLGTDVPWHLDGVPVEEAGERDPGVKYVDDDQDNYWRAEPGETVVRIDGREGFRRVLAADPVPAEGPDAVYVRTEHGGLFGRAVDELAVGSERAGTVAVDDLGRLDDVDTSDPLPLEVVGRSDLR